MIPDSEVAGVLRIADDPSLPRPHVLVIGSMHGNEPCGLEVLRRLERKAREGELTWAGGTLVLVHGNPRASEEHKRHGHGGVDLNRLFDWSFEEALPPSSWVPEHHRALELRPIIEDADVMLDLHTTEAPTEPFVIMNEVPGCRTLAARLGLEHITRGWFGDDFRGDATSIGVMRRQGKVGIGVECGQHLEPLARERGYGAAIRLLQILGVLQGEPDPPGPVEELEMYGPVVRPSETFRFRRPFRGLEALPEGEIIGGYGEHEIRTEEPCHILLPNDRVPVGTEMLFFARPVQGPGAPPDGGCV